LSAATATGGGGTGASLEAASLLAGRSNSGEPGSSLSAGGAAAAVVGGAGAGAATGMGAGAGAGVGSAAGAAAGADAAGAWAELSCCCAMAVEANRVKVAASNVPRDTRRSMEFLPGTEVRSCRLPCGQSPTFRPLRAIGFTRCLSKWRSQWCGCKWSSIPRWAELACTDNWMGRLPRALSRPFHGLQSRASWAWDCLVPAELDG